LGVEINVEDLKRRLQDLFIYHDYRPRRPREIYVTEAISCLRKAWLRVHYNASPPPTSAMIAGKLFHIALQEMFKNDEILKDCQFEVECSYNLPRGWVLRGRADAILGDSIFEFKFTREPYFNEAKDMYYLQTSIYCKMLNKPKGFLIMIDRGRWVVDVITVEPEEQVWNETLQRVTKLIDLLEKRTLPKNESPRFKFECEHCEWRMFCDKEKPKS
jgi:CRISPR/Cas system-associated exonuclease Cas4 (RecB family)